MTAGMPSVTSRQGCVLLGAISTVSVSFTRRPSIPTVRAVTSADSIWTTPAITTPVTVDITQLTVNAIDDTEHTIRGSYVRMWLDITFLLRRHPSRSRTLRRFFLLLG